MAGKKTMMRRAGEGDEGRSAEEHEGAAPATPAPEPRREAAPPRGEPRREATSRPPPAADDDVDFATMLEQSGGFTPLDVRVGDRVKVRLIHAGKDDVFFALGPGQDAVMSRAELLDDEGRLTAREGDELELFVVALGATITLSRKMGGDGVDVIALEQAKQAGIPVEGKVTGFNKGGLEVDLKGARGFCPLGLVDVKRFEDPAVFVGRTLSFLIAELKEGGKNVVLNRRALLEREREQKAKELLSSLAVGQVRTGVVTRVTDFGAFVDLGGVDGLVPLGELSWGHVKAVTDVANVGDQVTVEVARLEDDPKRPGERRIGLTMRASGSDPWLTHGAALVEGAELSGRVQRLESYGAFIELFEGVVGLAHVSELSERRVRHPSDVLAVGDDVTVRLLEVDEQKRRLSLSLKKKLSADDLPREGQTVRGRVTRVERYGVFLELDGGGTALLPAAESGTPQGADLSRALPVGSEHEVMIIAVDDTGRIKVSKTAGERAEENRALDEHKAKQTAQGFGTFADLFNKQKR